jgi:hypothetical protein
MRPSEAREPGVDRHAPCRRGSRLLAPRRACPTSACGSVHNRGSRRCTGDTQPVRGRRAGACSPRASTHRTQTCVRRQRDHAPLAAKGQNESCDAAVATSPHDGHTTISCVTGLDRIVSRRVWCRRGTAGLRRSSCGATTCCVTLALRMAGRAFPGLLSIGSYSIQWSENSENGFIVRLVGPPGRSSPASAESGRPQDFIDGEPRSCKPLGVERCPMGNQNHSQPDQ